MIEIKTYLTFYVHLTFDDSATPKLDLYVYVI